MEKKVEEDHGEKEEEEAVELILFQVPECYVYLIPPRKSAASYRADEWDVNKWAWEGSLKVISKGEECIIKLQDKTTGELYARGFLRDGEPHPVEPVIDSSRSNCNLFLLQILRSSGGRKHCGSYQVGNSAGGRLRHAFLGIGFRERPQAYDFQAALQDHMKYLNKKKTAEEMEQQYEKSSSVDYSLKEGETLVLQIKNKGGRVKSAFFEQGLNKLALDETTNTKEPSICIKPPPPPPLSPVSSIGHTPAKVPPKFNLEQSTEDACIQSKEESQSKEPSLLGNKNREDVPDEDFGDFQTAG
ncbi:hypothetical protein IFM89_029533 [Coptis chinensis]|uniref:NECAP PHear domain-containing protein n=1 Tax=Coptis chinensis TaxID=261450 RepID=A0A835H1L1_9MAGN|nr:hypothetical protein IFM89_029533 [Coptis chinensis]